MKKQMNHIEYPKSLKSLTDAELKFRMKDAHEAAMAYPEGENVDYYYDEVCYCSDELFTREKNRKPITFDFIPNFQ